MSSFKEAAVRVLTASSKPLHVRAITKSALTRGWLKTDGATPEATMAAVLVMDFKNKGKNSRFVAHGGNRFGLNSAFRASTTTTKPARVALPEERVKHAVIQYLSRKGWGHFSYGGLHEHGVDIVAKKNGYGRYLKVEAKGLSETRTGAEVAFVYSVGQIVQRMTDSGKTRNYYGIALPDRAAVIALRRLPWQVAKRLLLSVYSVSDRLEVQEYGWKELKRIQTGKGR